jgi:DNA-directed RNA polymerase specialized sigma24 family protein
MKWRTSPMAKYARKTNYRAKYPGLSDEIIEVLEKSDRKMEYQQYDLKVEHYQIDCMKQTVTFLSSREDSYERLLEEQHQFAIEAEGVEDTAVKTVMIEKMLTCLKLLTLEEQELIKELFFMDKSEHQLSRETEIAQRTIHDRKVKVLAKLKKLLEK